MADLEYHANAGTFTLGTETEYDNFVGGTVRLSAAEIDGSKQGSGFSSTDTGLKSAELRGTFFLDSDEPIPDVGVEGTATWVYRDVTTDGSISGTFVVTEVSAPYQLNNYAAFDVVLKNKGTYTIVAPIT